MQSKQRCNAVFFTQMMRHFLNFLPASVVTLTIFSLVQIIQEAFTHNTDDEKIRYNSPLSFASNV